MRTRDGGRTWVGIPAPKATLGGLAGRQDGQVSVLRFADATNGWAGVNGLYSTHDGGATWHVQHVAPAGSAVTAIETGGGYVFAAVGCPAYGDGACSSSVQIYASPIGRDRWTKVASGIPGRVGDANLRVHGDTWYLPTMTAIYRGTGTGAAAQLANPCPSEDGSRATATIAVADSTHLDGLCLDDGAGGSARYRLYGTTDGGHSWQQAGTPHREPSDGNAITDNGNGVLLISASSGASVILRTTDDGKTLSMPLTTLVDGGRGWADLGFTTTSQAVVVLPGALMYLSRDAGASFTKVSF